MEELLKPDDRCKYFSLTPALLKEAMAEIKISAVVPDKIKAQIEICKKLCLHGYFVYEFFTVAMEKSFLVVESALRNKYSASDEKASEERMTMQNLLDWAHKKSLIKTSNVGVRDALRSLRNMTAHPKGQTILAPGPAISTFRKNVDLINGLFE